MHFGHSCCLNLSKHFTYYHQRRFQQWFYKRSRGPTSQLQFITGLFFYVTYRIGHVGGVVLSYYVYLRSVLCCDANYDFRMKTMFIFNTSCLQEGPCLDQNICVCLCIVVSNAYCVVFLLCFSSSCVPYVASFSGFSIFYCIFGIL